MKRFLTLILCAMACPSLVGETMVASETPPKTVNAAITDEAIRQATEQTLDAQGGASDQEPPQEEGTEKQAGGDESLTEAFSEMKNVVDILNRMKISGYIQAQYVKDDSSVNALTSATATRNRDQFSVRRARLKFTYQVSPSSRFVLQPDITSSGVVLKDGYLELTEPWTTWKNTLTAGQFNWPFGFEIMYSSSDREVPERSRVVRTLFPGERDRGVMLSGRGFAERFYYMAAIVNGTGTAQSFDFNKRKDFVGRVGGSFGILDLGASLYRGSDLIPATGITAGVERDKEREGVDFQLITPVPGLGLRGEYIQGKERGADVEGWYAYVIQNLGTRHQFVVRADDYDPDTNLNNTAATRAVLTLGGSYIFHWDANSKVMATYEHSETEVVDPDDDVFTLRYQFKF